MRDEMQPDWTVVAVEQPFVLDLGPDLPACLGVLDLIDRRGSVYRVIDHKSSRFYDSDGYLRYVCSKATFGYHNY